jgi:UPF0716 protein FxsA
MAFLLLIVWPLVELFVIVEVAIRIGVLWTLLALIVSFVAGVWVIRTQGAHALRRLATALAAGRSPGWEVLDGTLILFSGLLLIVPGFIADVVGLLLLVPLSRALARRGVARSMRRGRVVNFVQFTADRFGGAQPYDVDSTATDLDSTATDVDQPRLDP